MEETQMKGTEAKETRVKILRAAEEPLARHGYHNTTMIDLVQAVCLRMGSIFHHFSTKEAILNAVVDSLEHGMCCYFAIMESAKRASLDLVDAIMRLMCDHFNRNPESTVCLVALTGGNRTMEVRLKRVY
jgi:AcrR family transcriptional regulator